MAKQIQMTKVDDVIKCSEDHIEHFTNNGFVLLDKKAVDKKTEQAIKETKEKE